MTTYKKEQGINIKSYSSDPPSTYPSSFEGQLYYNSSTGQFKIIVDDGGYTAKTITTT